jgi:MarR family transcriptional regulator, organic hydroperoxide resistance regulator
MLHTISHLIVVCARMHRGLMAEQLQALGLASGEELVLAELWREDGLTQADLARRLALRRSTVTVVLRTMEQRGLVARVRDEHDRRVVRVHHTERSLGLRPVIEGIWRTAEKDLLSDLSREETTALRVLLQHLRRVQRR